MPRRERFFAAAGSQGHGRWGRCIIAGLLDQQHLDIAQNKDLAAYQSFVRIYTIPLTLLL
jgi:hypothetical protein